MTTTTSTTPPRTPVQCISCGALFQPRLAFQVERSGDEERYYCSLPCRAAPPAGAAKPTCEVCGTGFELLYAYQAERTPDGIRYLCSEACRAGVKAKPPATRVRRIAVLNQKGGTGKTTTSVSIAAGIAEQGGRVLLIDADPQGNVGVSLGIRSANTLYEVMIDGMPVEDAVISVSGNLDVLTSDERLAAADIKLAQRPHRSGLLKARIDAASGYTHVVVDCGPSLSLLNQNALCAVDEVLIPVACDYLSLVGVKQVLKTIKNVSQHLGHPVVVGGVLPTFYDRRVRICRESLDAMRKHFGDLCLEPVRINSRLKEAPSHKKTIFEHDPSSAGAQDYLRAVEWLLAREPASTAEGAKAEA